MPALAAVIKVLTPVEEIRAGRAGAHGIGGSEAERDQAACPWLVRRVLDGLAERDRSLLRAVFLEERDKDEVCTELGVDRDYLRVLLHRAKASFRTSYSKQVKMAKYV